MELKWLQLKHRISSTSNVKTDGCWSYPLEKEIWIYYKGATYKLRGETATTIIAHYRTTGGNLKVQEMHINIDDLVNRVTNPRYFKEAPAPPTPKLNYSEIKEFGEF